MRAWSRGFIGFAVLVALLGTVSLGTVSAAHAYRNYGAVLMSANENPASDAGAMGIAYFTTNGDGSALNYSVYFWNITDPQAGHIHIGNAKTNGPVVVTLFDGKTTSIKGTYSGMIASGTITEKDFSGPMQGKTMSDLLSAIQSGNTYANFHTTKDPGGAARGQLGSFEDLRLGAG